ncbi:MAG: hypothetical protein NUK62_08405 [Tenericutes bacterium]|nr:hypothetical protein [Mycoplasmatota bacterium]
MGAVKSNRISIREKLSFLSGDYRLLLLVVTLGLIPILITKYYTGFPLAVHTDWMTIPIDYKSIIKITQYGMIVPFGVDQLCSRHMFGAAISLIFNINPLSLLWCIPFILTPVVAAGSFLLSYSLSKNSLLALIAGIASSLLLSGTPSTDFPVNTNAGSIVFVLFPLLIYLVYTFFKDRFEKENVRRSIQSLWGSFIIIMTIWLVLKYFETNNTNWTSESNLLVTSQLIFVLSFVILLLARYLPILKTYVNPYLLAGGLGLLVIHTFYALYYVFIIACFISIHWILLKKQRLKVIILLFSAFTFFYVSLQIVGLFYVPNINLISSRLFSTLPPYDMFVKFQWLTNALGAVNIILLSIGGLFLLLGKNEEYSVLAILALILFFYFSPEAWAYRFLNASTPFIAYAIAHISSKVKLHLEQ